MKYESWYRQFRENGVCPIYDYWEAVKDDVIAYLEENSLTDYDTIYDDCFVSDAVTGNASGSYYCNARRAEWALFGNTDLLNDAIEEFGGDAETYKRALQSPEYADVTIRCYILSQVIDDAISEYISDNIPDDIWTDIENLQASDMIEYIQDNNINIA